MKKIVFLPLDERPCNLRFAEEMTKDNQEFFLAVPPESILGQKKTAAKYKDVAAYLEKECKDATALILSVDMLLYGGIVPSRLHHEGEEELTRRLSLIGKLKENNPALKIYAYALVMRCPRYSSADEEPDYYEICGRELFLTGQAECKYQRGIIGKEEYEREITRYREKTAPYIEDFLGRRKINFSLILKTLKLAETTIDYLVIPQDDSSEYGYTAIDREALKKEIASANVSMYCGADEVGGTLLARAVNESKGTSPKMFVRYCAERGRKIIPLYEDKPLEESVRSQIAAAGCEITQREEDAELLLYINVPTEDMADIGGEAGAGYAERDLNGFTGEIAERIDSGKRVILADVAYCNGGDSELVKLLSEKISLFRLSAYAGWNTSSNTLGCAIAQGVMSYHYGNTSAHRAFLAERFYEDVGYCGYVRKKIAGTLLKEMGLDWFRTDGKDGKVAAAVKEELNAYIKELLPEVYRGYELTECTMPWSRMFEVSLSVKER